MNKPYSHTCVRCGNTKFYRNPPLDVITKRKHCTRCHLIPDETLKLFIKGVFARICPECKSIVEHFSYTSFRAASNINSRCKSCAGFEIGAKVTERVWAEWVPIIGNNRFTYRTIEIVRKHWNSCDETERQRILKLTPLQKKYFWGHVHRKRRVMAIANAKKAFAKYRGENHWMKRAKVYLKVLNSCQKYCGDNHWFKNPNYVNGQLKIGA